ncbi:hypothetical protein NL676_009409 [Syzygium grande]|nr:hypothetical protein NL676_009409 [Syzygium grande]
MVPPGRHRWPGQGSGHRSFLARRHRGDSSLEGDGCNEGGNDEEAVVGLFQGLPTVVLAIEPPLLERFEWVL